MSYSVLQHWGTASLAKGEDVQRGKEKSALQLRDSKRGNRVAGVGERHVGVDGVAIAKAWARKGCCGSARSFECCA